MTEALVPIADGSNLRAVGARTGAFFTAHGRMVFAVCRAILRDADAAADATQATFLSAHEALLKGTEVRDPGAWLATIARNECRAQLRARALEPLPLCEERICASLTTDDDVERRTTVEALRLALGALPEKQREAVVLRDLYGLHYGEIGKALGVSRPSVEALLFRARRTLRLRLRPAASGALAVPLAIKEGLAQAIPFFSTGGSTAAGAAGTGFGVVVKVSWPAAAKAVAGTVVIGATALAIAPPPSPAPEAPRVPARPTEVRAAPSSTARPVETERFAVKRRSSPSAVSQVAPVKARERIRPDRVDAAANASPTEARSVRTTAAAPASRRAPDERPARTTRSGEDAAVSRERPVATVRGASEPERARTGSLPAGPAAIGSEAPDAAAAGERGLFADEQTAEGVPGASTDAARSAPAAVTPSLVRSP